MEPCSGWPHADHPSLRLLFYLRVRNRSFPTSLGGQGLCHFRGISSDRYRASFDTGKSDLFILYGLIFLHGTGRAFHGPALHAIVPNIVSRKLLDRAIAMSSTSWNGASIVGPVIAGYLILMIDRQVYYVIALASAATLIGYLFIPSIKIPQEKGDRLKTLLAGIKYVRDKPIVLGGLTIDLLMVGLGSVMVLLPVFAADILRGSRGTWIDARNAGDR